MPDLHDRKETDIAILCPASFAQVENYPESVMENTRARHYIPGHWEDCFANDLSGRQKFVRATDQDAFMARFLAALPTDSSWAIPEQYFLPGGVLLP